MDWLEFLASIVDSLAWPTVVCITAYLLRKPLVGLLPNLRHLKYRDLDIRFGEGLEKLEREFEAHPSLENFPPRTESQKIADERFELLAEISPDAAVLEAWTDIGRMLRILAERHDITDRRHSVTRLTEHLRSQKIISNRLAGLLNDLRDLRNTAAHPDGEKQITLLQARRYKELIDHVGAELELLVRKEGLGSTPLDIG